MTIRLAFHGATRTVTGSCYLLEANGARVAVDCGMFQGSKTEKELNYRDFPFPPGSLDALVLTHAHIDHTGLMPKLVKLGYGGPIHSTQPTVDLCAVMLPDSGYIQEMEVRQLNQRNRKRGLAEVQPIYTLEDAKAALESFEGHPLKAWFEPARGIRARFWNAGHLLGSASIEIEVERQGAKPLRLLFSGDIGPDNKMLHADPEAPQGFDHVICESTYGGADRLERDEAQRRALLADEVKRAAARHGALLIPSFAVERTQELITDLVSLMEAGEAPAATIFIDSPLANKATAVFTKYAAAVEHGNVMARAFTSELLKSTESVEDSKAIARFTGFHIIVAASGMCDAGRIRHHLKNHLWRANATVLLAGFQAAGSLGRLLEDGASTVRIMGEEIEVKAAIRKMDSYSGHADGPELIQWLRERQPIAGTVFLTHGEEQRQIAMAADVARYLMPEDRVVRPRLDDVYELSGEKPELLVSETRPRIAPESVARLDWHNDLTKLVLDINDRVGAQAGEKARAKLIRKLRRALEQVG